MRRSDPGFASVRRSVQIIAVAALLLVLGARPVTVDALSSPEGSSSVPGNLVSWILIHTTSTQSLVSSPLTIQLVGDRQDGPYGVHLNAEKSIAVLHGAYTARARVGAVSCPNQTLKAEKGKHVDVFYRSGNAISCTRPPR